MEKNNELREKLMKKRKNGYEGLNAETVIAANSFSQGYMSYLDSAKTEREASAAAVSLVENKGYIPYSDGASIVPGGKYYTVRDGKLSIFVHIGKAPLEDGVNIIAAHIDSPRLDLKPTPLYEDNGIAYFKTHYYGGIRKYQWVAIPLELHGVVVKPDGEKINVNIGSCADDPVFCISDLLPHLAREQGTKPLNTAYTGESLNPIVSSVPYDDDGSDKVKLTALSLFFDGYGITEEDFASSELSFVPAGSAREVGLDRSMIGSYGQDDRVCAYSALAALLDEDKVPDRTSIVVLADKEEIGSEGISGMKSAFFDHTLSWLCGNELSTLNSCLENSICLSCDVSAAFDPCFPEVYEKHNSAYLNGGVGICKYTGSGGKGGSNDANAETIAKLRNVFARDGVLWQLCELGKTDVGGGGTVAKYMSERGIETIDAGTPVLSMHSPFELTSKLDVYMTYLASKSFLTITK